MAGDPTPTKGNILASLVGVFFAGLDDILHRVLLTFTISLLYLRQRVHL